MAEPAPPAGCSASCGPTKALSQQHVANQLGISRSTVANLEAGRHWMSDDVLQELGSDFLTGTRPSHGDGSQCPPSPPTQVWSSMT